jgi:ATP-binding cassette subfamily B (MDR/TAP) protein 1
MSGLRISARLRLAYLRALFKQPVSTIDSTSPGKIASRLTSNSNTIQMGISQQFARAFQSFSLFFGLYIVAFIRGPLLAIVASASIPVILLTYIACVPFVFRNIKAGDRFKEKASSLAFEIFESVRIVAAFGAEGRLGKKHSEIIADVRRVSNRIAPVMGLLMAPMFFASYSTFALTFWFGIREVTGGHLPGIAQITTVLFSVMFATTSLGQLFTPIMAMVRAASAAAEIFVTIDSPVPDMTGLKDPDVSPNVDILFKDVTFAYPTRKDTVVLNRLNLRFETGKTTAIVGPSGSGKSTVVGLLQRWYHPIDPKDIKSESDEKDDKQSASDPDISHDEKALADEKPPIKSDVDAVSAHESEKTKDEITSTSQSVKFEDSGIFIGDTNLNNIDVRWWRKNIGLVQQEPFLFNDTILNNVSWGLSGTHWNDLPKEEKRIMVESACKEAYAHEFIQRLPEVRAPGSFAIHTAKGIGIRYDCG